MVSGTDRSDLSSWFQKRARQHTLLMHGQAIPPLTVWLAEERKRRRRKNLTQKEQNNRKRSKCYIQTEYRPLSASVCGKLREYSVQESMSAAEECQQRWAGLPGTVVEYSPHVVCDSASTMQRNLCQIILRISSRRSRVPSLDSKSKERYHFSPTPSHMCI